MQPAQPGSAPKPREPFWQSMAGMITAIAALITALVGVGAFIYQTRSTTPDQPAATGAGTAPHSSAPAARPSDPGTPPVTADADLAGSGPYTLGFTNYGVDLDADPPRAATRSDTSIDIYDGGGSIESYPIRAHLANWSQPKDPGRADCANLLNSFPVVSAKYIKGSRYCVWTRDERHIAFVKFVEEVDADTWKIQVIVWPGTAG